MLLALFIQDLHVNQLSRLASFPAVKRVHEVLLAIVFHMVGGAGVKNPVVRREQKARLHSARLMVVAEGVNTWAAPKVLRVELISAFPMEVEGDAPSKEVVPVLPGESRGCASVMVVGKGARSKTAQRVLRVWLAFALLTVVAGVASIPSAPKVLRAALNSVRPTAEEKGAPF